MRPALRFILEILARINSLPGISSWRWKYTRVECESAETRRRWVDTRQRGAARREATRRDALGLDTNSVTTERRRTELEISRIGTTFVTVVSQQLSTTVCPGARTVTFRHGYIRDEWLAAGQYFRRCTARGAIIYL